MRLSSARLRSVATGGAHVSRSDDLALLLRFLDNRDATSLLRSLPFSREYSLEVSAALADL